MKGWIAVLLLSLGLMAPVYSQKQPQVEYETFVGQLDWIANNRCHRGNFIVLDSEHLLTSAHVLRHEQEATTLVYCNVQGKLFAAVVTDIDPFADLAMLKPFEEVRLRGIKPVTNYTPFKGQKVLVYSHTFADPAPELRSYRVIDTERTFRFGPNMYSWDYGGHRRITIVDEEFLEGQSGSGVFTFDGRLIGIVSARDTTSHTGIFSPIPPEWLP